MGKKRVFGGGGVSEGVVVFVAVVVVAIAALSSRVALTGFQVRSVPVVFSATVSMNDGGDVVCSPSNLPASMQGVWTFTYQFFVNGVSLNVLNMPFNTPNEGGVKAWDLSGHGNDGTLRNGVVYTQVNAPQVGRALGVGGLNGYVEVPDAESLDVTNGFSIEVWVRGAQVAGHDFSSDRFVVKKASGVPFSPGDWFLGLGEYIPGVSMSDAQNIVFVYMTDTGPQGLHVVRTTNANLNLGVPYVIDVVVNNGVTVYKNGVALQTVCEYGTCTAPLVAGSGDVYIGGDPVSDLQRTDFLGELDQLKVYRRPLTVEQVQKNVYTQDFVLSRTMVAGGDSVKCAVVASNGQEDFFSGFSNSVVIPSAGGGGGGGGGTGGGGGGGGGSGVRTFTIDFRTGSAKVLTLQRRWQVRWRGLGSREYLFKVVSVSPTSLAYDVVPGLEGGVVRVNVPEEVDVTGDGDPEVVVGLLQVRQNRATVSFSKVAEEEPGVVVPSRRPRRLPPSEPEVEEPFVPEVPGVFVPEVPRGRRDWRAYVLSGIALAVVIVCVVWYVVLKRRRQSVSF